MNIETFREYCLDKPGVTEDTPFGPDTLCFRVGNKLFALLDIDNFESVNLKCDPERAVLLRERHDGIKPGYHMNKKHWNTVSCNGSIRPDLLLELVDHSYALVFSSLPKILKEEING